MTKPTKGDLGPNRYADLDFEDGPCPYCAEEMTPTPAPSAQDAAASEGPSLAAPEKNRRVVARMVGAKDHSDATWHREGWAFMTWWGDRWNDRLMADACRDLDADHLEVEAWFYPDEALRQSALLTAATDRAEAAEASLRTVQNAAKTIASAHGTELEHLRQNATYDHRLRAQHESMLEHDAQMTEALMAAETRAEQAEAALARNDAEAAGLRATLQTLLDEGPPRPVVWPWRDDGQPSKHDRCPHGVWMYEDCGGCVDAFVAAALAGNGAPDVQP